MESNNYRIRLFGYMTYRNAGGVRGYTAFCRVWDPRIQAFLKPVNEDPIPEYDRYDYIS